MEIRGLARNMKRLILASLAGVSCALAASAFAAAPAPVDTAAPDSAPVPVAPPAASVLTPKDLVRVLSDADIARYRAIFAYQEKGDWGDADARIVSLENDVLMGYVLYQRYMHPTAYRSSYHELASWLDDYADVPGADRVYSLAMRRRPAGVDAPTRAIPRRWRSPPGPPVAPEIAAGRAKGYSHRLQVARIESKVRGLLSRERATQSLNYISDRRQRRYLTDAEYDRIRSWIAAAYYHLGYTAKAERLAVQAAEHGDAAPDAYWVAGLSAWRNNEPETAFRYFSAMAKVPYQDEWSRAGGAFWAARAALAAEKPADVTPMLEIAASAPLTFYGQLALAQLGRSYAFNWTPPALTPERWNALTAASPRIARAAALIQVGRPDDAFEEFRRAHGELSTDHDADLLAAASSMNLPDAELFVAIQSGGDPALEAGLFPVPDFTPVDGFGVDRALLFAMARQESKFQAGATSRAGARGLLQLMPSTARYVTRIASLDPSIDPSRLHEPATNLAIGQAYVRYLMERGLGDDLLQFAVAYNGGPGNLRRWKAATPTDDTLLFIESIPSPETRDYVERVLTNLWIYRDRLGQNSGSRDAAAAGAPAVYDPQDVVSLH